MYDVAIIGAGINGAALAFAYTRRGKRVLVLEKSAVAAGGSGAAGAFIAPKFSKAGELKELICEAFGFSMEYYQKYFSQHFQKTELLHIAKDAADDAVLKIFKERTSLLFAEPSEELLALLQPEARVREKIFLEAGLVDAAAMCHAMLKDAEVIYEELEHYVYKDDRWLLNGEYRAKKLVFATGAYKPLHEESYIKLRGVWGHRIDIATTLKNRVALHQFVSVSPAKEGVLSIGATHNVHYHPELGGEEYDIEAGQKELLQKAAHTVNIELQGIVKNYTGLRSGSFDYLPLIGPLVDGKSSLQGSLKKLKSKRPDTSEVLYHPHLYMINGSGGYGFVLAPLLAEKLYAHMEEAKEIEPILLPLRFFVRHVKRCV